MLEQYGIGADDIMFAVISIIAIYVIRFWLIKIYRRVRQIAKILEHFLRKDREEEERKIR
jgi:hypothetical protein